MKNVVFILDESGSKGYSNNKENILGELGVMAGYIIPRHSLTLIKNQLDTIRANYFSAGKVHITDLQPPQQAALRKDIFNFFIANNIPWVYEAIYVQGFFESSFFINNIIQQAKALRQSDVQVQSREEKELLQSELFQGVFAKAVAFCSDHFGPEIELEVITDRTDDSIIEEYSRKAKDLLSITDDKKMNVKGFDKVTKQNVEASILIKVNASEESFGDFSGISFTISCEDSSLTLAADVLVNSVNHHLKDLQAENPGVPLNIETSIEGHLLSKSVCGLWNNKEGNYFADAIFMHPTQKGVNIV